jgi:methyl-accepting chemotaxis protein
MVVNMKKMSLKLAVFIPSLIVLITGIIVMVIIVGSIASSTTQNLTDRLIEARVNQYANEFDSLSSYGYAAVKVLASVVEDYWDGAKDMGPNYDIREDIIDCLSEVVKSDKNILALWTCWEPDALDGADRAHININEHHDSTGRFVPYIYRDGANVVTEPLSDYDHPVDGLYYLGARNSKKPYITDPYPYEIGGKTIPIYSIAVPIVRNGVTAGVVGVDISLADVIEIMNAASILDDGYLCVFSPGGLVATHRNESMILEDYKVAWLRNYSAQIDSIRENGGSFNILAYSDVSSSNVQFLGIGVKIGDTDGYWVVCGLVPQKTVDSASNKLTWVVIGVGLALIVVTGITILLLITNGLKKLPSITALAERIAKGDTNNNFETDNSPTRNEITLLERPFADISNSIKFQADIMNKIAHGDYSVSVDLRCEADVMNKAINEMLVMTNNILNQIIASSEQVSNGSKQIADGAQSLAQGSTEQAATLEQLSASIYDISVKTQENADRTSNASHLADEIMKNAEKGNKQMEQMIIAVNEINQANQNISKVIKTIDDIAFQTNILALNAAVEAARAGTAGKGFAVVAEEVRNLATKSAESAKDTGNLIANSMEKAELGTRIASETAESLNEIVSGISESAKIIADISKSSDEQSGAVNQINNAIGGVTQVVQQNSATAEQSAAASEEMSGQSAVLEDLVAKFKLK